MVIMVTVIMTMVMTAMVMMAMAMMTIHEGWGEHKGWGEHSSPPPGLCCPVSVRNSDSGCHPSRPNTTENFRGPYPGDSHDKATHAMMGLCSSTPKSGAFISPAGEEHRST